MYKIFITVLIFVITVNISFTQRKTFTIDERWVGKIKDISTNGFEYAFTTEEKKGDDTQCFFVTKDTINGPFDGCSYPVFSGDGTNYFYQSYDFSGSSLIAFLHFKNNKMGPFNTTWGDCNFLKDGNTFGCLAILPDGWSEPSTSGMFDYFGTDEETDNGLPTSFCIIVGNEFMIIKDSIAFMGIDFSDDGSLFSLELINNNYFKIGSVDRDAFTIAYDTKPVFTSDNQAIYVDKINEKSFVLNKYNKIGPYDSVWNIKLSPDEKTLSYVAKIDTSNFLFINDKKLGPFDNVTELLFSNDSKNIAYIVSKQYGYYLYFNDKIIGSYMKIGNLVMSYDNKNIAYIANMAGLQYVINNPKQYGPFEYINRWSMYEMQYKPNSSELIFVATNINNEEFIYNGDEIIGPFYDIGCFDVSLDGKYLAYVADNAIYINQQKILENKFTFENVEFSLDNKKLLCSIKGQYLLYFIDSKKTYVGSLYKDGVVYVDGNQIIIEPYEK